MERECTCTAGRRCALCLFDEVEIEDTPDLRTFHWNRALTSVEIETFYNMLLGDALLTRDRDPGDETDATT